MESTHRRSLHEGVFRNSGFELPSATVVTVSLHLCMRLIETGRWLGAAIEVGQRVRVAAHHSGSVQSLGSTRLSATRGSRII